jgi:hypothetical protein
LTANSFHSPGDCSVHAHCTLLLLLLMEPFALVCIFGGWYLAWKKVPASSSQGPLRNRFGLMEQRRI